MKMFILSVNYALWKSQNARSQGNSDIPTFQKTESEI